MTAPASVRIDGWGMYVPERVLTNDDLATLVETNDEWIRSRSGIRERRGAGPPGRRVRPPRPRSPWCVAEPPP